LVNLAENFLFGKTGQVMFNFRYEDGFKISKTYFPAISRKLYLSTETISKPSQSHETIPLSIASLYFGVGANLYPVDALVTVKILLTKVSKF
jgi:hypothetical protein